MLWSSSAIADDTVILWAWMLRSPGAIEHGYYGCSSPLGMDAGVIGFVPDVRRAVASQEAAES